MADPSVKFWVIADHRLREALRRAHAGEDPGLIEAELYANSDHVHQPPDTPEADQ